MIRIPTNCPKDRLPGLLDDSLGEDETARVAQHLDTCEECRSHLEAIAANDVIWRDTRTYLSDQSVTPVEGASGTEEPHLQRLLPDLQPSDDPNSLGRLDEYEIESLVGWGGMGVVLKARDTTLSRTVAIKVLHPHLAASGPARKRFSREARAAAAINHPSVVPIHAVDAQHCPPYLVMAFVPGGSLQDRIDQEGPLSVEETLRICLQIAEGLSAAHQQGVVHRDVKPANILLDHGQDRVVLSDFGLAQALDDASLTCSGMIAGTPQFMSPEQARGEAVDARSDLFSLGGMIYAMLTGRPPFRAPTTLGVLRRIEEESIRPIQDIQPQTPAWVQTLVGRLHAKDREARVQSAHDLVQLLKACLSHLSAPHHHPVPSELLPTNRPTWTWWAGATVMVAIGVLMIAWFTKPPTTSNGIVSHSDVDGVPKVQPGEPSPVVADALQADVNLTADRPAFQEPSPRIESAFPHDVTQWEDGLDPILQSIRTRIDQLAPPSFEQP